MRCGEPDWEKPNVRKSAASESKRKSNGGDDDPYKSVSKKAKPVSKSFPLPTLPSLPKPIKNQSVSQGQRTETSPKMGTWEYV